MIATLKKYKFLLSQLVKRDFIQKYKKTALGIVWSVLSPLCEFLILYFIFSYMFGRNTPHYTTYLMTGILVNSFYTSATTSGLQSVLNNAGIINKIKLPIWLFPLSKNLSATITFLINCVVLVIFLFIDNISFSWVYISLLYPVILLFFFNYGVSLILGTCYVFFKDTSYLFNIFNRLLYFCCAIFWNVTSLPEILQKIIIFNPVYDFILYFRTVLIDNQLPSAFVHLYLFGFTLVVMLLGCLIYSKNKNKYIFYL